MKRDKHRIDDSEVALFPRVVVLVWRALVPLCALGFFASTAYFIFLLRNSPRVATAATNQTAALNNHGTVFYVRPWEALLAQSSFVFIGVIFVSALSLQVIYGRIPDAGPQKFLNGAVFGLVVAIAAYMFWPLRS